MPSSKSIGVRAAKIQPDGVEVLRLEVSASQMRRADRLAARVKQSREMFMEIVVAVALDLGEREYVPAVEAAMARQAKRAERVERRRHA